MAEWEKKNGEPWQKRRASLRSVSEGGFHRHAPTANSTHYLDKPDVRAVYSSCRASLQGLLCMNLLMLSSTASSPFSPSTKRGCYRSKRRITTGGRSGSPVTMQIGPTLPFHDDLVEAKPITVCHTKHQHSRSKRRQHTAWFDGAARVLHPKLGQKIGHAERRTSAAWMNS